MIKLSIRLNMIMEMVRPCSIMADVGADHGYLACALVQSHKCVCAYAMDVAPGPLNAAKRSIEQYGLNHHVFTRLSDGLTHLPQDVETIVIAGMGAHTIIDILNAYPKKLDGLKQIIVSANKDPWTIRNWIMDHGYTIDDERCCYEEHDYVAISFTTQPCIYPLDPSIRYLGPKLMQRNDGTTQLYYRHLYEGALDLITKVKDEQKKARIRQQMQWLDHWFEMMHIESKTNANTRN